MKTNGTICKKLDSFLRFQRKINYSQPTVNTKGIVYVLLELLEIKKDARVIYKHRITPLVDNFLISLT